VSVWNHCDTDSGDFEKNLRCFIITLPANFILVS
jgi:hypothetical protein